MIIPLISILSNSVDVITDYLAFSTYVVTGEGIWGLATLSLILLSAFVTSTFAVSHVFFHEEKSKFLYSLYTKTPCRRVLTYMLIFCNFGPALIHLELLRVNWNIFKCVWQQQPKPSESQQKQEHILKLLVKLAVSELMCESLGQGILQTYILSNQLGKEEICFPDAFENPGRGMSPTEIWLEGNISFKAHMVNGHSGLFEDRMTSPNKSCDCNFWVAKGAEYCYPSHLLANQDGNKALQTISCLIADCTMSKRTFRVIFPFIQVIISILQISFCMTHLGAFKNLQHLASMHNPAKKILFYIITFPYFLVSLGVSLLLSTYLANIKDNGVYQLMAFLSVLRILLPEATPLRRFFHPWLIRVISILLPLIAHLPLYLVLYSDMRADGSGCTELERNRITIHLRQNWTLNQKIATYLASAPGTESTLSSELSRMGYFPINLESLSSAAREEFQFPAASHESVYNIRNRLNVFGHFFLWTGYLIVGDISVTLIFLSYWIFVMKPHHTVPNLLKLMTEMIPGNKLLFPNLESPLETRAIAPVLKTVEQTQIAFVDNLLSAVSTTEKTMTVSKAAAVTVTKLAATTIPSMHVTRPAATILPTLIVTQPAETTMPSTAVAAPPTFLTLPTMSDRAELEVFAVKRAVESRDEILRSASQAPPVVTAKEPVRFTLLTSIVKETGPAAVQMEAEPTLTVEITDPEAHATTNCMSAPALGHAPSEELTNPEGFETKTKVPSTTNHMSAPALGHEPLNKLKNPDRYVMGTKVHAATNHMSAPVSGNAPSEELTNSERFETETTVHATTHRMNAPVLGNAPSKELTNPDRSEMRTKVHATTNCMSAPALERLKSGND